MRWDRQLFGFTDVCDWRHTIKSRLKHWRKLANLSQRKAAALAKVSRSTWQAWEDKTQNALPDIAQISAVADACRIEPGAALDWLAAVADAARVDPSAALDWLIGGAERRTL